MDIEIVRPSGHDELLIYLIDEDECRLIATYPFPPASDFPMPELAPGYGRAIEARNDVVDWLNGHIDDIRAAILEQWRTDKELMEKAILSDAEPELPARRLSAEFWTVLARRAARLTVERFLERGQAVRGMDEILYEMLYGPDDAEETSNAPAGDGASQESPG